MKKLLKKMCRRDQRRSEMFDWGAFNEAEEARRLASMRSAMFGGSR